MKTILSVGQCNPDNSSISGLLKAITECEVLFADDLASVRAALSEHEIDLILVNRILDATGEPGIDVVSSIKQEPKFAAIPWMLVSNFDDAQKMAVEEGALPGFGKSELGANTTRGRISDALRL